VRAIPLRMKSSLMRCGINRPQPMWSNRIRPKLTAANTSSDNATVAVAEAPARTTARISVPRRDQCGLRDHRQHVGRKCHGPKGGMRHQIERAGFSEHQESRYVPRHKFMNQQSPCLRKASSSVLRAELNATDPMHAGRPERSHSAPSSVGSGQWFHDPPSSYPVH
jgi:hypothetical protein